MLNLEKINQWFKQAGEKIVKLRWLNLVLFITILALAFIGIRQIKTDVSNDNWFLEDDPMLLAKERFEEIFGNNDFGAILVEADNVFKPEILAKIRELGKDLENNVPFANEVISLTDFEFTLGTKDGIEIIDLVPDIIPTSKEGLNKIRDLAFSKPAMVNKIVSDDSKQTWIMLRLKTYPDDWEKDYEEDPDILVGHKINEIVHQDKYKILHPKTTGLPILNVEKRNFFNVETPRLMFISLIITVLILAVALRSFRGVIFPILTALGSIVIVFGAQGYLGIKMDPSMVLLPFYLGLAVAIGYSIHVFNYFKRQFCKTGKRKESVFFAVEETGWPIFFTALTTIAALLSFLFIPVRNLRWIGLTAAALVGVTYFLVMILTPSLLSFGKDREPHPVYEKKGGRLLERSMGDLSQWILARPRSIITIFILMVIACIIGMTKFEVSFDVRRTMGLKIPYVARFDYIGNTKIGSLYSYDIAIEFSKPGAAKDPENLKNFDQLIEKVNTYPLTKKVSSLLDVIKDMNQVLNEGNPEYYKIPETRDMVAQLLLLYENAGGTEVEKWVDYDYQRLHLMVEVNTYNSGEAKRELDLIQKRSQELFPDAKVVLIGSISQFTVMQDYVSWGQIKSFLIALIVIALLMIIVFGSIKTGLIGMIPNVAPALAVGGIMGFAGIPLDMMTVTIMPMLLGLAVDDTIHLINHTQLEFNRTCNYAQSIRRAFIAVGTALFMTSIVLILNFSTYLTSVAKVFVHIGILAGAGILAALLADYFVTPILLKWSKPFGEERT
jgi:predicted RND superfamily exporter protein